MAESRHRYTAQNGHYDLDPVPALPDVPDERFGRLWSIVAITAYPADDQREAATQEAISALCAAGFTATIAMESGLQAAVEVGYLLALRDVRDGEVVA